MGINDEGKIRIFCSYAHEDEKMLEEIKKHVGDDYNVWYDREIKAGQNWAKEIDDNLNKSDVILLLISADFKASKYCTGVEMELAQELEEEKGICIIPILLRSVYWRNAPFSQYQMLPREAKPVTDWEFPDDAYSIIAQSLDEIIEERRAEKISGTDSVEKSARKYFDLAESNITNMVLSYDKGIQKAYSDIVRKIDLMRKKGNSLYDLGKIQEALGVCNEIIDLIKNNNFEYKYRHFVYKERGDIFRDLNLLTKALADYEMAIHLQPDFNKAIECRNEILEDKNLVI